MASGLKAMKDKNISCILAYNKENKLSGILTERDIVQKFSLLEKPDKLQAKLRTVMTRPVRFVTTENLRMQMIKLHKAKSIRHFPVLSSDDPDIDNLLGIITFTDLARAYLKRGSGEQNSPIEAQTQVITWLSQGITSRYQQLLSEMGFEARQTSPTSETFERDIKSSFSILIDLDNPDIRKSIPDFREIFNRPGKSIFITSDIKIRHAYLKHLKPDIQFCMLKPIDISYLRWILDNDTKEVA